MRVQLESHSELDIVSYNRSKQHRCIWRAKIGVFNRSFCWPTPPKLRLFERLWWFLKKIKLLNEHCAMFTDLKPTIDGFFRNLDNDADASDRRERRKTIS